jgi:hypothetical protein
MLLKRSQARHVPLARLIVAALEAYACSETICILPGDDALARTAQPVPDLDQPIKKAAGLEDVGQRRDRYEYRPEDWQVPEE